MTSKRDAWSRYDNEPTYLYALVASDLPRTIRYVGVTRDPDARLAQHSKRVRGGTPVQQWAREVRERGAKIEMLALGSFPSRSDALEREWRVVRRLRGRGMCDLNLARDYSDAFFAAMRSRSFRARFGITHTEGL